MILCEKMMDGNKFLHDNAIIGFLLIEMEQCSLAALFTEIL